MTETPDFKMKHDEPQPPGLTVRIENYPLVGNEPRYSWIGFLDGRDPEEMWVKPGRRFPTLEAAEADAVDKLTELVSRVLPDLEREDIAVSVKLALNVARE